MPKRIFFSLESLSLLVRIEEEEPLCWRFALSLSSVMHSLLPTSLILPFLVAISATLRERNILRYLSAAINL